MYNILLAPFYEVIFVQPSRKNPLNTDRHVWQISSRIWIAEAGFHQKQTMKAFTPGQVEISCFNSCSHNLGENPPKANLKHINSNPLGNDIWAIYYNSKAWTKVIWGRTPFLNHQFLVGHGKSPILWVETFCEQKWSTFWGHVMKFNAPEPALIEDSFWLWGATYCRLLSAVGKIYIHIYINRNLMNTPVYIYKYKSSLYQWIKTSPFNHPPDFTRNGGTLEKITCCCWIQVARYSPEGENPKAKGVSLCLPKRRSLSPVETS